MALRIKKDDMVMASASHAYSQHGDSIVLKNQVGRVISVSPKKGTALVEGLNIYKKHEKPKGQNNPGGIIERETPLPMSKLMLVEPGGQRRAARFKTKVDDKGIKTRVLKLRGESKDVTV